MVVLVVTRNPRFGSANVQTAKDALAINVVLLPQTIQVDAGE